MREDEAFRSAVARGAFAGMSMPRNETATGRREFQSGGAPAQPKEKQLKTITSAAYDDADNTRVKITYSDGSTAVVAEGDGSNDSKTLADWIAKGNTIGPATGGAAARDERAE